MYRSHNTESCGVHVEVQQKTAKNAHPNQLLFALVHSNLQATRGWKSLCLFAASTCCCDAWVAWWHPSRSDSLGPTGNNRQKELMEGPRWRQNPMIILYFLPLGQDVWKPCCIKDSNSSQSNVCTVDLYQACVSTVFRVLRCSSSLRRPSCPAISPPGSREESQKPLALWWTRLWHLPP